MKIWVEALGGIIVEKKVGKAGTTSRKTVIIIHLHDCVGRDLNLELSTTINSKIKSS